MNFDFQAVFREHWRFVWRTARRLGASEGALDDIVQEVFVAVSERLHEFRGDAKLKSWLYLITRNKVLHHLRGQTRHQRKVDAWAMVHEEGQGADPYARQHAADELYRSLDQLDEAHREVFVLAELEQMPGPEIAEVLQIKLTTVYSRLRTASERLRKLVDGSRQPESSNAPAAAGTAERRRRAVPI